MTDAHIIISIFTGIGLAAATGFRVFLPLFALSLANKFHIIHLNEQFAWIGSHLALIVLGIATAVEIIAYLIPWVDNLLDTIAVPLAGIAGTLVVAATFKGADPVIVWSLALIAGGGTATAIQTSTTAARATSTVTTGGITNPVVGFFEGIMATIMSVLAVLVPVIGFILVLLTGYLIYRIFRRKRKPL
jgi:hypothetical protein